MEFHTGSNELVDIQSDSDLAKDLYAINPSLNLQNLQKTFQILRVQEELDELNLRNKKLIKDLEDSKKLDSGININNG
jgi:hypothetical protein